MGIELCIASRQHGDSSAETVDNTGERRNERRAPSPLTIKDLHLIYRLRKIEFLGITTFLSHVWIDLSILCVMGDSIIS